MGRMDGKVALITGAARGQGRAHAVRLAQEGAEIIAVDVCAQLDSVPYDMATPDDLAETAKLVEDLDRRVVTREADVRNLGALQSAVQDGVAELGHLDVVCANAGIASFAPGWELSEESFQEMIDVNLTGVWKTLKATVPTMIEQGTGGSIVLTSSIAGLRAFPNLAHYTAAKHGVTGLMRTFAVELAPHDIRVNSVHPTTVSTGMIHNPAIYELFLGVQGATYEDAQTGMTVLNAMKVPWVEAVDISNAVLWLASDEARYVTGTTQIIDAGALQPFKIPHEA
ncbi:mycofactocin-coupled SDR family oxidoreductase [Actinomycetospora lemnae]|uniref:Mycofactocin-coupled SDR family oxidoreductase n=1 Tax=Actinomycetospora lemnae TaxID=3019891 RepID=A0ABT5T092_9PSEU|nr:mycofactocin-coupled SDR family oxidoreductase [Actinomycetospora sp. DW7H6]MDD7968527.1 mycofactocin-coupled SDR family oxidoreductase [Actinomycetospora sp. DW7H6]